MSDISEILSSVASNPDLLDKISSAVKGEGKDMSSALGEVISLISQSQGENNSATASGEGEAKENYEEASLDKEGLEKEGLEKDGLDKEGLDKEGLDLGALGDGVLGGLFGDKSGGIERLIFSLGKGLSSSTALLIALKPFLKKSRQDFIEVIIKLSKLGSIAGLVK